MEDWLDSIQITPRTRSLYLSRLHGFYVWAIREELTEVDPTTRIAPPKLHKLLPRPMPERTLETACALADPRMRAMLVLGAYEGLRCMEIAGLRVEDIWWNHDPPLLVVRQGKGGKERTLPLSERAEKALLDYGLPERGPVFPKQNGGHYRASSISMYINSYLRSVGVRDTAHQLRHLFGTNVYRRSKDLVLTQEMMGHSDPSTTRGYVAFSLDEASEVVRSL